MCSKLKMKSPKWYQSTLLPLLIVFISLSLLCLLSTSAHCQQTFLVLQTSWRRLGNVFSVALSRFPRCFQDVFKTCLQVSSKDFFKTSSKTMSSRRPQDVFARRLLDVFKETSCKHVLKTSWRNHLGRRLNDVLQKKKCCTKDFFKTFSTCLLQDECLLSKSLFRTTQNDILDF